jgi:proline iminopeptidase
MRARLNGTEIFFDIDGAHLGFAEGKLKSRPTIVALHGGPGFDHGYLKPGLGPLRDFAQVIYVDLRGQGRSGRPALESCTLEQMADDVVALCQMLDIDRPVVFGHSAGGFVALHMAIRHPGSVGGLILCGSAATMAPVENGGEPSPTLNSRAGADVLAIAGRVFGGDISEQSIDAFFEAVVPFYAAPSHMDVPGRIVGLSSRNIDIMRFFMKTLAPRYDLLERLGRIRVPALVMVGRHDWVCPPRASRTIARGIAGAKLVEVADAGHFLFSEQPEQFLGSVSAFLAANAS